jgi:hypothetical protein
MPRQFLWRLPQWAYDEFQQKLLELENLGEFDDEAMAIHDQIRSLPGFPNDATEWDFIDFEITTVRTN